MAALTIQERIDAIDQILARGISSVKSGNDLTSFNLSELRKERAALLRQQSSSSQYKRVVFK